MSETHTEQKTFTEDQVSEMMMRHRRGLQARVIELEQTVRELRRQLTQLTVPETNPLVRMLLSAIGFARKGKSDE